MGLGDVREVGVDVALVCGERFVINGGVERRLHQGLGVEDAQHTDFGVVFAGELDRQVERGAGVV